MPINISYSRVSSYLNCPYGHFLGYVERIRPKKPVRPLYFGSDFHRLLENRADEQALADVKQDIGEKFYEMPPDWQADLGGDDYVSDLSNIFEDYTQVYKNTPLPDKTEQEFLLPIGKYRGEQVLFKGFIDELYFTDEGIKIGEHKTFSRQPNMSYLVMNMQKSLYAQAVHMLYNENAKSVIWDYICSSPAAEPVWLEKSQRFSNASSTKITPYSWERACKRHNITDKKVLEQAQQYEPNVTNFFFRVELEYIPEMVEKVWDDFKHVAKDIVIHGDNNRVKNVSQNCSWCQYHDICYAELTGANTKYIIDKDFEHSPSRG